MNKSSRLNSLGILISVVRRAKDGHYNTLSIFGKSEIFLEFEDGRNDEFQKQPSLGMNAFIADDFKKEFSFATEKRDKGVVIGLKFWQ